MNPKTVFRKKLAKHGSDRNPKILKEENMK